MSHPWYDQTRLLVAKRHDEESPMIIGAYPMTTWEVVPEDEYDEWMRATTERFFGPDWTSYETMEVLVTIPQDDLLKLFAARDFGKVPVEPAPE